MGIRDDILPDTDIERERTLTGKWAIFLLGLSAVTVTIAFVSPHWMAGDPRIYGTKVESVGLWVHCFRSLPDYNDYRHQRYFAGCRWLFNPFTEGYDQIRNILAPRNFASCLIFSIFCGHSIFFHSVIHRYALGPSFNIRLLFVYG